jgi:hypothetical protein
VRFLENRRWWTRAAARRTPSLDGRWLPLLAIGGVVAAMVFSAWRFEPAGKDIAAAGGLSTAGSGDFHQLPAVRVTLRADSAGRLAAILFNGRPVRDAAELRDQIMAFRGTATDATLEADLDCDANLQYEETQRTIAAISSYPAADRRTLLPLVDRVKLRPQH